MARAAALALALSFIFVNLSGQCYGQLQFGFYRGKCGANNVEVMVRSKVLEKLKNDPTIVAALLRLQFHDCFVKGCDASILLDGSNSEKTAPPNLSVRGYDFVDEIKTELENSCPGVVSCADIIVMATRDAVSLSSSGGMGWYAIQTGRRDGLASSSQDVNLPSPNIPISQVVAAFKNKGLDATDMVYLLGAHTVGVAHCSVFQNRLYNFQNTSQPDPAMNTTLLDKLRSICPQNSASTNTGTANLDQNPASSFIIDKSFYQQILLHNGILQVDQELALDSTTKYTVTTIANSNDFSFKFGQAMIKLGAVQVLTGRQGEIRNSCRAVNNPSNDGDFNLVG